MTCATATYPQFAPLGGGFSPRSRYRGAVFGSVAIGCGTVAASFMTAAFGIVAAAWIAATAFSANFHIHASGPVGPAAIALARLYHMRIDAAPQSGVVRALPEPVYTPPVASVEPSANPAETPNLTFGDEPRATAIPTSVPESTAPLLSEDPSEFTSSVASPMASLFDPSYSSKHEIARFSLAFAAPQLATAAPILLPSLQKPLPPKASKVAIWLPDRDSRTAVYDIAAHMVYLPNGDGLEAHSGLGHRRDDPRFVHEKNRGPTPPNVYNLRMREATFHGIRAIRLNPVAGSTMFGRDGILAHTYMLGSNGQSFGCVSFKNYNAFLRAFLNREIDRMVVVPRLGTMVAAAALARHDPSEQSLDE